MLPFELHPLESNNRLLQLPAAGTAHAEPRPAAPSPSSGYIIAVG
jgi:hypothetical protein